MYDFLKQHAITNVWCSPEQDKQVIVEAQRITRPGGELGSFQVMMRRTQLPKSDRRFHVFQIGQAHPALVGLLPRSPNWMSEGWCSFSEAVEALPVFCDLYTDKGVHLPLYRSYYMYTDNRALIFAIDVTNKSPIDYETEAVYLRLYTNAYFESIEGNGLTNETRTYGSRIVTLDDVLTVQGILTQYRTLPGIAFCYVNGVLVDTIDLITAKIGDDVEFIYDGSVKRIVDLPVKDLLTFTSTLDSSYKYLLHYPDTGVPQIDYVDDIDVYVVHSKNGRVRGRFLHRNQFKNIRMVTHRDYSLSVDAFRVIAEGLAESLRPEVVDLRDFSIRLYLRKSGLLRPLVYDRQRIFELYKLADADVVRAMVGVDATLPYWTADALEHSAYTELMRVPFQAIDIDLINRAYGFNAITKLIGDSPIATKTQNASQYAILPKAMQLRSTVFEYNAAGDLLGFYPHTYGEAYIARQSLTRLIDPVVGTGSTTPSVYVGTDNLPLPAKYSYRVYMCYVVNGEPTKQWTDITGSAYYTNENETLHWTGLETDQWLMVRTDENFLAYEQIVQPSSGIVSFKLTETVDGVSSDMSVPMGDLDLWLNGKSLIEGLDYLVDFPLVVVHSKVHLAQPADTIAQQITVRFSGFCDKDLKRKPTADYGFVEHGVLSNNTRFDLRDDKVVRIAVAGQLRTRTSVIFSEQHAGVSITDALNGSPYQVKSVIVPVRDWSDEETYALQTDAVIVDAAVEAYMTQKLPQPPRPAVSAIPNRYILISPFFCHLVNDLKTGVFNKALIQKVLGDSEIIQLCAPYESLLYLDPVNPELKYDARYTVIHPTSVYTPVALDLDSYRFMQRVVTLYGRGRIVLSPHLVIG